MGAEVAGTACLTEWRWPPFYRVTETDTLWRQPGDCICLTVALAYKTLLKHVTIVSAALHSCERQNPPRIGSANVYPTLPAVAMVAVAISMPNPSRNVSCVGDGLISN